MKMNVKSTALLLIVFYDAVTGQSSQQCQSQTTSNVVNNCLSRYRSVSQLFYNKYNETINKYVASFLNYHAIS